MQNEVNALNEVAVTPHTPSPPPKKNQYKYKVDIRSVNDLIHLPHMYHSKLTHSRSSTVT